MAAIRAVVVNYATEDQESSENELATLKPQTEISPEKEICQEKPISRQMKFVLIGDSRVGKTSLAHRFIYGEFDCATSETKGVDFTARDFNVDGMLFRINLFDTSGQDSIRTIAPNNFRFADAILLVFDCTAFMSFRTLADWLSVARTYAEPSTQIFIVGTKSDRHSDREVPAQSADRFARSEALPYFEVSTRTGDGVEEAFANVVRSVYNAPPPEFEGCFVLNAKVRQRVGRCFSCA